MGAKHSKSFILSLILLPPIVQMVIMMVNGNIGTGIAVMGAFSLIRFRSVPGSAREIVCIFLSMAIGLATATGYIGIAVVFTVIICIVLILFTKLHIKGAQGEQLELKITIPESLNYVHAFDDLFALYTSEAKLVSAKTTNLGSLLKLHYHVSMKDRELEQELINELRCRNGNLEIALGMVPDIKEEL